MASITIMKTLQEDTTPTLITKKPLKIMATLKELNSIPYVRDQYQVVVAMTGKEHEQNSQWTIFLRGDGTCISFSVKPPKKKHGNWKRVIREDDVSLWDTDKFGRWVHYGMWPKAARGTFQWNYSMITPGPSQSFVCRVLAETEKGNENEVGNETSKDVLAELMDLAVYSDEESEGNGEVGGEGGFSGVDVPHL
ncbi:hypothetical protein BJX99DRAFT_256594 [Aspergillus californicus]